MQNTKGGFLLEFYQDSVKAFFSAIIILAYLFLSLVLTFFLLLGIFFNFLLRLFCLSSFLESV